MISLIVFAILLTFIISFALFKLCRRSNSNKFYSKEILNKAANDKGIVNPAALGKQPKQKDQALNHFRTYDATLNPRATVRVAKRRETVANIAEKSTEGSVASNSLKASLLSQEDHQKVMEEEFKEDKILLAKHHSKSANNSKNFGNNIVGTPIIEEEHESEDESEHPFSDDSFGSDSDS